VAAAEPQQHDSRWWTGSTSAGQAAAARASEAIAREESAHAALAWRTAAWAMAVGGEPVRQAVRAALHAALGAWSSAAEVDDPVEDSWSSGRDLTTVVEVRRSTRRNKDLVRL
jgi:hypothetical protein